MVSPMHLDYRRLRKPVVPLRAGGRRSSLLLVAVLFAPQLNDTRRWLFLAGLSVQPSELAKLALVLFLAYQIDKKLDRVNQPRGAGAGGVVTGAARWRWSCSSPTSAPPVLLVVIAGLMLFLAGLSWRFVLVAPASRCRRSGSWSSRCRTGASASSPSSTPSRTRSAAASRRCSR